MAAFAGLNLRVEDVSHYQAACVQATVDPNSIPILAILHDDDDHLLSESLRIFAPFNVAVYRCMSPNSQLVLRPAGAGGLPTGAHVIAWNEHDEEQSWWDSWWKQARAQRPDLVIHYGAPDVNNQWPLNTALLAQLDVQDVHIGSTFGPPTPAIAGKPVWVTEIDIDPGRYEVDGGPYPWGSSSDMAAAYSELLECMRRCLAAGIPVFAWGIQAETPEVAYDVATLGVIAQLNRQAAPAPQPTPTTGGKTMPTAFTIGPGFAAKVQEKGWHAASDEVYFAQDANAKLSVLSCDEGLLFYDSANNKVGALPFS